MPPDGGLTARMFLTMFLLALVYLAFIAALLWFGVNAILIALIAGLLLLAQYYFSDRMSAKHCSFHTAGVRSTSTTDRAG